MRGGGEEAAMMAVLTRFTRPALMALVLGVLTVISCDLLTPTRIAKIAAEPNRYQGKNVTIIGTVKERIDVPSIKCYILSDGKGSIGVITKGNLPLVGDKVRAKGRVEQSFAIGIRKLVVIIETPKATHIPPSDSELPKGGPK
jgi:hypothetical protein